MTDAQEIAMMKRHAAQARREQAAAQQKQQQQQEQTQAADTTASKRQSANNALGDYNGKVRKHQETWVQQNRGQHATQAEAQTAWQTSWDNSNESETATAVLLPYLADYSGAAQHEMRLAAEAAGSDPEAVRRAIQARATEIRDRETGTDEDTILDGVVDQASTQVSSESPELRSATLDVTEAVGGRDQALVNVQNVHERRDRAVRGVQNMGLRQEIRDSFQAEIDAAERQLAGAEQTLTEGLRTEFAIAVADGAVTQAEQGLENVNNLPAGGLRNAERPDAQRVLGEAQYQRSQVLAGNYDALKSVTPEQIDDAVASVFTRHPELRLEQNQDYALNIWISGEALKRRPEIDMNLASLSSVSADPQTADWMKKLIETDPVSAAVVASLETTDARGNPVEVYTLQPGTQAERLLAQSSPMTFVVLKYAGGRLDLPEGTLANIQPMDVTRYGQEATARQLEVLQNSTKPEDETRFNDLQFIMLASGDVRASYLRQEWERVVARESPEQSLDKMLEEYLDEQDFNNPDFEPTTEVGKFLKLLSINMQASFTPGQQMQIWDAVGGGITSYFNDQAQILKSKFGDDDFYPAAVGEWQKQMAQFAAPPVADALINTTVQNFDPTLVGKMGGGRMTDGSQLLADRAGLESAGKLATWLTAPTGEDMYSVPLRDFMSVKEDGTGATLGQALLTEMGRDGADQYALQEMQSWYDAGMKDVQETQSKQFASDQFKLFNENRDQKLQDIFDNAIKENGDVFTQRLNFGTDPVSDNTYGQRLGLTPDNPNAATGEARYTDPAKLERIRTLKQIDWISRGANLPVDLDSLIPLIAAGQALPDNENLRKIKQIQEWVREVGGDSAQITFTPAVYASEDFGTTPLYLMRVEGDKNNDGVITRDETSRPSGSVYGRGTGTEHLDDEDMIIDSSMAGAAVSGENVPWKYNDLEDYRKDNMLDDDGKLYLTGSEDLLLHDDNRDGRVDNINFAGVDAAITTGWEHARRWGDVAIGVAGLVAGGVLIVGTGGLAAPLVATGAALYFGYRTVETAGEMSDHGQSFNPINSKADGAWFGFIDPTAGGFWLGAAASISGFAALRPLALTRSLAGLRGTGTLTRGLENGLSRNIGTELFLRRGLQTNLYRSQLAALPRSVSITAEVTGGVLTLGEGQSFVQAASRGEIDWTDWSLNSSTWDFTMMGGSVASLGAGYAAAAARRRAQSFAEPLGQEQPPPSAVEPVQGQDLNPQPPSGAFTPDRAAEAAGVRQLPTRPVADPDNFWPRPRPAGEAPRDLSFIEAVAERAGEFILRRRGYSEDTYRRIYGMLSPEVRALLPNEPGTFKPDEMTLRLAQVPGGLEKVIADIHAHMLSYARESGDYLSLIIGMSGMYQRVLFGSIPQFCGGDTHWSNANPSPASMRNAAELDARAIQDFYTLFARDPAQAAKADLALTAFDFSDAGTMDNIAYALDYMLKHPGMFAFIGEITGKKESVSIQLGPFGWNVKSEKFQSFLRFAAETGLGVLLHYDWGEHPINDLNGRAQAGITRYQNFEELVEVLGRPEFRNLNIVLAHTGIGRFVRPDSKLAPFTRPDGSTVMLPEHIHKLYELFERVPNARADISWNDVTQAYADSPNLREGLVQFVVDNQDRLLFGSDTVKPANSGQLHQALNTGSPIFVEIARRDPIAAWKLLRGNYETVMADAYSRVARWTREQPEMTPEAIARMDLMLEVLGQHRTELEQGARQEFADWLSKLGGDSAGRFLSNPNTGVFPYLYNSLDSGGQNWRDGVQSRIGRGTAGGFAQEPGPRRDTAGALSTAIGAASVGGVVALSADPSTAAIFDPTAATGPADEINASAFEARALLLGWRALYGESVRLEHEAIFEHGHLTRGSLDRYVSRLFLSQRAMSFSDKQMLRVSAATEQFWENYQYLRDVPIDDARGWTETQRYHAILAKAGEYLITIDRELMTQALSISELDARTRLGQLYRSGLLGTYLVNDAVTLSWLTSGNVDLSTPTGQLEASYRLLFGLGNAVLTAHTTLNLAGGMRGLTWESSPALRLIQTLGLSTIAATGVPWTAHDAVTFLTQLSAGNPIGATGSLVNTVVDAAFTYYTYKAARNGWNGLLGNAMPKASALARPAVLLAGALALRELLALGQEMLGEDENADDAAGAAASEEAPHGRVVGYYDNLVTAPRDGTLYVNQLGNAAVRQPFGAPDPMTVVYDRLAADIDAGRTGDVWDQLNEEGDTGRINPDLQGLGYAAVQVRAGDTLWDIADTNRVDFPDLVDLNSQHIHDPSLIVPGDKVYLPRVV